MNKMITVTGTDGKFCTQLIKELLNLWQAVPHPLFKQLGGTTGTRVPYQGTVVDLSRNAVTKWCSSCVKGQPLSPYHSKSNALKVHSF